MNKTTLIKSSFISIVLATSATAMADGEAVYKDAYAVCHTAGIAGSTKTG